MRSLKTLDEVSDGKIYDIEDLVEADAKGCEGCSACCHDVGDLVILTPFDVHQMMLSMNVSFELLLKEHIELVEHKKIFLPHLRMQGASKRCSFLDAKNRCKIHEHRPNICRLFPLGRVYEGDDFKYFLQVNSCKKKVLEKIKVKDWIGIADYKENKQFLLVWHDLLKALTFRMKFIYNKEECESLNHYFLDTFYRKALQEGEFYRDFWSSLPEAKQYLGII